MVFDPNLQIGQEIHNEDVSRIFACGNMGGMRRSISTNTLVLVSDYTKGLYHDKWIAGVLHYTGMGQVGDQSIHSAQNKTLAESDTNGVNIHLFEVMEPGIYTYCGVVKLVGTPYQEIQPDSNNAPRKVWMFPIRPVPDNDVKKPTLFTFQSAEEYDLHGKEAELLYAKERAAQKKSKRNSTASHTPAPTASLVIPVSVQDSPVPANLIGKQIEHVSFGVGSVTSIEGDSIIVSFPQVGEKKIGYQFCLDRALITIL